jgi:dihydrodipicolinate synthase/N-acetylneuraminate lyase
MVSSSEGLELLPEIPAALLARFRSGMVIPAVPLALHPPRTVSSGGFDMRRQAALLRYYIDAGAGGLAVGVHTTQFAIREPAWGLFEPVLQFASSAIDAWCARTGRQVLKVAGICGRTDQAVREAAFARQAGYHAGLVSLGAFREADPVSVLVEHYREVAEVLPVIGFYLQPAVGGRLLPYAFWRQAAELERFIGVKMAPFNRYQTLDVVRAVCDAGQQERVALYTGNDDHIVDDLVTPYVFAADGGPVTARVVGGLLGQWAVWTRAAVALLDQVHALSRSGAPIPATLLSRGVQLTDANAAIFDAAHGFAGCIPGIHEVLRRQGLLAGTWCLDENEVLSPGQAEEISRVSAAYPELTDDAFVTEHLDRWLAD